MLHPGHVHPERSEKATEKEFVDADREEQILWQALSGLTNARDRERLVRKLRDLRLKRFMEKAGDQPPASKHAQQDAESNDEPAPFAVIDEVAFPAFDEHIVERIADEALENIDIEAEPIPPCPPPPYSPKDDASDHGSDVTPTGGGDLLLGEAPPPPEAGDQPLAEGDGVPDPAADRDAADVEVADEVPALSFS